MESQSRAGRRNLRLRGYDYAQAGAYFVTICTHGRVPLFGDIVDGVTHLNEAGRMVVGEWNRVPIRFPAVQLDAFILMPTHFHAILFLTTEQAAGTDLAFGQTDVGATTRVAPTSTDRGLEQGGASGSEVAGTAFVGAGLVPAPESGATTRVSLTLGAVIGAFKSVTTARYARGVRILAWPPFHRRLWQRNCYEHVVRDDEDLNRIRTYIGDNPLRWDLDPENPSARRG